MSVYNSLNIKYPPSEPCECEICRSYCRRPGWWTVEQAEAAIKAGYYSRMMIEISPELDFAVISPAFKGCEGKLAVDEYALNGCNFYKNRLCELHSTQFVPIECRFCHHDRMSLGILCHSDLEKDWNTKMGKRVVKKWCNIVQQWDLLQLVKSFMLYESSM